MGMGYAETVGDGFKVCGDGWGWEQKFVPVQVSNACILYTSVGILYVA